MKCMIAPSILSSDFGNLSGVIEMVNKSEADWIHCDVMDGRFVPNISFGFPILQAVKKTATKPLDVHLMIVEPEKYLEAFKSAGANNLTVHFEACIHLHRTVQAIQSLGMTVGVAINPHTPVILLRDIISNIDLICMMSVNPGFGGQKFIEHTYTKIADLKKLISQEKSKALIEVDGGVDFKNAGKLFQEGADILVAGNSIFSSGDPAKAITILKNSSSNT